MNTETIVKSKSDGFLKVCVDDIIKFRNTNIVGENSNLKIIANEIKAELGEDYPVSRMAEEAVLFEVALRWKNS